MTIKEFKMQYALGSLSRYMLLGIANCPSTSGEILTILSRNKDYWVRHHVAANQNTPARALTKLSNAHEEGIRVWVASNRHTTKKVLEKLVNDKNEVVRKNAQRTLGDSLELSYTLKSNYIKYDTERK